MAKEKDVWPEMREQPRRGGARWKSGLAVFLGFALLALLAGCQILEEMALVRPLPREDAIRPGDPSPWEGQLEASARARLAVPVTGQVEAVLAAPGQEVAAGEELLRVDDREAALELRRAEAEVARLQSDREKALGRDELDLLRAEIELAEARLAYRSLQKELVIARHLVEEEELTAAQLEELQLQAGLARQKLQLQELLQEQRENEENTAGDSGEIGLLEGELALARAALELARQRYEACRVTAPFSGHVAEVAVREGEWLEAGRTALVLEQMDPLLLVLQVEETRLHLFSPGDSLEVQVPAAPERERHGRVAEVTFLEAGWFRVEIAVDNPEGLLRPGMTARVLLE